MSQSEDDSLMKSIEDQNLETEFDNHYHRLSDTQRQNDSTIVKSILAYCHKQASQNPQKSLSQVTVKDLFKVPHKASTDEQSDTLK